MAHHLLEQITNTSRSVVPRDREGGAERLYNDYFSAEPVYPENIFRRRFRMNRDLFVKIVNALEDHSEYFKQREDAAKRKGLSPYQKCTAAIRILAYGSPADAVDKYIKIGETTAIDCLHNFCRAIIDVFGEVYLRRPNADDVQRLLQMHEEGHRFPGMLGSLDCTHWAWKNCPAAWKGQYTRGDHGHPTIMLEVVASMDLWIWHAYFGVVGSNNDLNVLSRSNLLQEELQGRAPEVYSTSMVLHIPWSITLQMVFTLNGLPLLKVSHIHKILKESILNETMKVQEKMLRGHLGFSKLVCNSLWLSTALA